MKSLPNATRIARFATQGALATGAFFLGACSTTSPAAKPAKDSTERHGQVKFSSADEQIVGEIVIRQSGDYFRAEITKGPGVPLLTIAAKAGFDPKEKEMKEKQIRFAQLTGPLAHGGWTWRPKSLTKANFSAEKLKDHSRAWGALPEVFMWGEAQARGESFRVAMPDIVMHARATNGELKRFDYKRHQNPSGVVLPLRDIRKQPALETVICHLD